jgi:5-methyltetrahydrofolate--homocysteine methyltransferase
MVNLGDKNHLLDRLYQEPVLLDGGMGTEVARRGLSEARFAALANLTHPEVVLQIHRDYVEAGAEVLLTNTFLLSAQPGLPSVEEQTVRRICQQAVRLARTAAGPQRLVLGDIGPLSYSAGPHTPRQSLQHRYRQIACVLDEAGVDGLLLETIPSLWEAALAVENMLAVVSRPLLVSLYLRPVGERFVTAQDQVEAAEAFRQLGKYPIAAVGANCCVGPAQMTCILRQVAGATDLPLLAKPNAGLPVRQHGVWIYPESPETFAQEAAEWVQLGARLIGGCCGTTPQHIQALKQALRSAAEH